jgi:hypothetical protein
LIPQAITPHREWIATRLNIFTQAYNTNLVKKEELPKTYHDLLDPKWKGKLGIEAEDLDWFAVVIRQLGEEKGLKLFRDIVASNGLSVRKGHTLLTNLVASGEVPFALTVYGYKAEQLKNKGAPIDWLPFHRHCGQQGAVAKERASACGGAVLRHGERAGAETRFLRQLAHRDMAVKVVLQVILDEGGSGKALPNYYKTIEIGRSALICAAVA